MKYVSEFRDHETATKLANAIRLEAIPSKHYRFMEFCGGHTHAIFRHGVQTLMPGNVEFIHGPGCPVCILPSGRIDSVIQLLQRETDLILCTYGDVLRVPATDRNSLQKARAKGADIRIVYSPLDALQIAVDNPSREVIFFAIGFETTAPPTAAAVFAAQAKQVSNFYIYCNHVVTAAALEALLHVKPSEQLQFNGILGPSHVSTVMGSDLYKTYSARSQMPIVVAGFEPLDVMQSTLMLIRQVNEQRCDVENEYTRTVTAEGNTKAQAMMAKIFEIKPTFEWRGLGQLPNSGYQLRSAYSAFDAEQRFDLPEVQGTEVKGCKCPQVLRGELKPKQCKLFGTVCKPENPMGACMVSSEGACAAHWRYSTRNV